MQENVVHSAPPCELVFLCMRATWHCAGCILHSLSLPNIHFMGYTSAGCRMFLGLVELTYIDKVKKASTTWVICACGAFDYAKQQITVHPVPPFPPAHPSTQHVQHRAGRKRGRGGMACASWRSTSFMLVSVQSLSGWSCLVTAIVEAEPIQLSGEML